MDRRRRTEKPKSGHPGPAESTSYEDDATNSILPQGALEAASDEGNPVEETEAVPNLRAGDIHWAKLGPTRP